MKSRKGISLIVLVITIIVMIILAAAIILSLSNSGIISKANKAKADNDVSNAKELVEVAHSEWLLMTVDEQTENGGSFVNYATDKLEKSGYDSNKYILSEEGSIEVCVAKIGDTKFASLEDALDTCESNVETQIKLTSDVNISDTIKILSKDIITIDLAGFSINSVGNAISNSGTLTLKDTSPSKSGKIVAVSDTSKYNAKYDINNDGVVGQADMDIISKNYGTTITDDMSEEIKKCDTNGDGGIDVGDFTVIGQNTTDAYAILNKGNFTLDGVLESSLTGKPSAMYVKSDE